MSEKNLATVFNENNTPFAKLMGVTFTLVTKSRIEAEVKVTGDHCTIPANMHSGAIMAMADNMSGFGSFINMPEGASTATIESKTNFLRAIPMGETAKAVTTPINLGRTLQVWETKIHCSDGKLAAVVTQTQIIRQL